MRECFSPQLTPERLDMLSHDAAGWCIKPRREQQGTRAIVLTAELRIGTALLKKDGRHFKGILCQELLRAERPRREQQYVEAGREDVRDKRRIHQWLSRREVANQGIPVPTHCHKRTDSGLDALREWQHDAPVVRRLDASASVDIFSSVPAQVSVSNNMQESLRCPSDQQLLQGGPPMGDTPSMPWGLLGRGDRAPVAAAGHQSAGYEQAGAAPAAAAAGAQIGYQERAQAQCRLRSAGGHQGEGSQDGNVTQGCLLPGFVINEDLCIVDCLGQGPQAAHSKWCGFGQSPAH